MSKPLDLTRYQPIHGPWTLVDDGDRLLDNNEGTILFDGVHDSYVDADMALFRDVPLLLEELERWRELGPRVLALGFMGSEFRAEIAALLPRGEA